MATEPRTLKTITLAFNGDASEPEIADRMDSVKALFDAWAEIDLRRGVLNNVGTLAWHSIEDTTAPVVYVAIYNTGSFSFVAIEASESEARETMRLAWLCHVEQTGASLDYFEDDAVRVLSGPFGTVFRDDYRLIEGSTKVSTEPPEPDEEDVSLVDFDRVVERLKTEHNISAHVAQTGGNVACVLIGMSEDEPEPDGPMMVYNKMADCVRAPVILGPGWFEGPGWSNGRGSLDELFLSPDDQGQTDAYEPDSEDDIVDMAAFLHSRVVPHLTCKPGDHTFTVECHIRRTHDGNSEDRPCNDDQQRHDSQGRMCCNDCGVLLFHCETTGWYHHADIREPVCFLAKT